MATPPLHSRPTAGREGRPPHRSILAHRRSGLSACLRSPPAPAFHWVFVVATSPSAFIASSFVIKKIGLKKAGDIVRSASTLHFE
ncbi:uncharacterized protein LOC123443583 isoform X2 [Hordeum vulgare subsp. vulgare]|uniref:uncharacterized protein LOC123443583 isoform X2 n=1 Tax=Hordeum vulgare subsp. vulgare TaxID=112509 RepID=UPI001D1A4D66|nr:uncharacterized protein LOC123443583 isoform X2 [Hordeum vulgare subsp. vulgare]